MALLEKAGELIGEARDRGGPKPDTYVQERLKRAEAGIDLFTPLAQECWEFFRGNTYVHVNAENQLVAQATTSSVRSRKGKPGHRIRNKRPILTPFVRHEVSYGTQRVPSYGVTPSNADPQIRQAAKVSEKVAVFGHDKWHIDRVVTECITGAVVADEHFAWPYWDSTVGEVVGEDENGRPLHKGEVCVRMYGKTEVGWEPGVRFEDARWYMIRQARPLDEVLRMDGLLTHKIVADATDRRVIGSGMPASNTKLTLVYEYLERPSVKYPHGRRLVLAGGQQIVPEEAYPLSDRQGRVLDEPVLHKLTVITDPDSDRDLGLVRFALDAVRTYQDANNKALEYKNHMLPQVLAPTGTIKQRLTDEPNAVFNVERPDLVKFREAPTVPRELFEIQDRAKADLAFLFSQNDVPNQVEAGRAIQALIERDQNARGEFLKSLAKFMSRVMRHCLMLVAKHYTEPRILQINGDFGPETLEGFLGADLMDQTTVTVLPSSLEPRTREYVEQQVTKYAQLGWVTPEEAMAAIRDGTADALADSFERDRDRAFLIIQKIKDGPESLFSLPPEYRDVEVPVTNPQTGEPAIDPMTGQPVTHTEMQEVPGWMPREVDNVRVHKKVFADWMKSADWLRLDAGMREAARNYWSALNTLEAEQNAKDMAAQSARAQEYGRSNAARPQFSPMPSLPNPAQGNPGD